MLTGPKLEGPLAVDGLISVVQNFFSLTLDAEK
jgi:hypothetical protein